MNIDAKAREVVKKGFYSYGDTEPHGISKDGERWLTDEIAAALLFVRNEALEEAANVAEETQRKFASTNDEGEMGYNDGCVDAATAIRALKDGNGDKS